MFSRHTLFRTNATGTTGSDPLSAGDSSSQEMVGALNKLEPVAETSRRRQQSDAPQFGRHEIMKEMKATEMNQHHDKSFPSTGFSRSRKASRVSLHTGSEVSGLGITAKGQEPRQAQSAPPTEHTDAATDEKNALVALLPESLGKRLWQHFQVAAGMADLRDMVANSATGLVVLPQAPFRGPDEPDVGALLNDNVLFTDSDVLAEGRKCKFTTVSGIRGTIDCSSVNALGMLPPVEDIMGMMAESETPRATIFDVLDDERTQPLVRLRIVSIHDNCRLPDGRSVRVAVTSGALQRALVVDSAVTSLSANIYEAANATIKALLPQATAALTEDDQIKVDIEDIVQYARQIESRTPPLPGRPAKGGVVRRLTLGSGSVEKTPSVEEDTDAWQAAMAKLMGNLAAHFDELEHETSMCGDAEARRRLAEAVIECVEKLVCESVYAKVFAPWFSDDRTQDEQFASKVAALNLADIRLEHLGLKAAPQTAKELVRIARETGAQLQGMNAVRSPAEKLKLVVDAHKTMVDRMDRLNARLRAGQQKEPAQKPEDSPTSSLLSADSILPLLIFAVVTANPQSFISNLRFIQRYRTRALLSAQFEYCLTNALAVASFVESVDARKLGLSAEVSASVLERAIPPALMSLQNLLFNNAMSNVGIEVVQGVYGATLGKLIDTSSQLIMRAPWRSPSDRELQQGVAHDADEKTLDQSNVIEGVRSVLNTASEQLSHEIKGHLPRSSPAIKRAVVPEINERFVNATASDLTIAEVSELLAAYQELAKFVRG
ncbi:hypothetical protein DL89DRAFT_266017 [Linderina pennispora]|uniref:VPS9 domain-containing protein n=1 Tax=Linderina pennispora TaxID=61395 RepID=A0A1Y1WG42_9FUNG|nr:uncharacterized protein DL89DRAFT_266017 [Linderina pennispora]ORX72457.1 hypothetical protein DL89DRAFT_266017 [Linderina pennispora]